MNDREVIDAFSRLYYSKGQLQLKIGGDDPNDAVVQLDAHYCGYQIQKNPLDLWVYQEILWECKPDIIIEGGTASGASALYLAHVLDRMAKSEGKYERRVITIDIANRLLNVPDHRRIDYYVGNTLTPGFIKDVTELCRGKSVMVILDDDHSTDHVYKELLAYSPLVTVGQYLIVEDTNVDYPLKFGDGPGKAVRDFIQIDPGGVDFAVDKKREKFLMTWNPGGYLRRVR